MAVHALREALSTIYWYKSDLRSFLTQSIGDCSLLSSTNWDDYKRNIVRSLIDGMARNEDAHQGHILKLMCDVSKMSDFSHLSKLDGGKEKAEAARQAVRLLSDQMGSLDEFLAEEREIEARRGAAYDRMMEITAIREQLDQMRRDYYEVISPSDPQSRGYKLEKLLFQMFNLFDLDAKPSFRIQGEQIDGAFTFEGTDYLFEAKWQKELVAAEDLDAFAGKLSRKLDNTLGLFLSINGFSPDGVQRHSSGRRLMFLMDGSDLMAVLEARIDLAQLILRKRREASQTGNIYLMIHQILCGT